MTLPLQVKRKVVGHPATTTQQDRQRHDKQLHVQQHHNQQLPVVGIQDDQKNHFSCNYSSPYTSSEHCVQYIVYNNTPDKFWSVLMFIIILLSFSHKEIATNYYTVQGYWLVYTIGKGEQW